MAEQSQSANGASDAAERIAALTKTVTDAFEAHSAALDGVGIADPGLIIIKNAFDMNVTKAVGRLLRELGMHWFPAELPVSPHPQRSTVIYHRNEFTCPKQAEDTAMSLIGAGQVDWVLQTDEEKIARIHRILIDHYADRNIDPEGVATAAPSLVITIDDKDDPDQTAEATRTLLGKLGPNWASAGHATYPAHFLETYPNAWTPIVLYDTSKFGKNHEKAKAITMNRLLSNRIQWVLQDAEEDEEDEEDEETPQQ